MASQYGKPEYWQERYRDLEPFDWYLRWDSLQPLAKRLIKPNHRVLMLGCGTSRVSFEMSQAGYTQINNIDIDARAVAHMKEKHKGVAGLTWQVMNVLTLEFPDATFDAEIDKGMLDSVLCGDNSTENTDKFLSEVSRTLKVNGNYIIISHGGPDARLPLLENPKFNWRVEVQTIDKPKVLSTEPGETVYYVYIVTREWAPVMTTFAPTTTTK
eukprot:TRINITY_DN1753_c3_g1_i1.p1 TRINITY_DN1753_c3_g1~~TRINITY_DN1753_c3_g1_i1.p1  ORF type:complete len:213 (+),score=68.74 TRINITY_DN1753_c3_g1_i1:106-744(+)